MENKTRLMALNRNRPTWKRWRGCSKLCLEEELTGELIDAVADMEPMQFICLDKGFKGNDQRKANAVQIFKSRSQGAETEMVFKVV